MEGTILARASHQQKLRLGHYCRRSWNTKAEWNFLPESPKGYQDYSCSVILPSPTLGSSQRGPLLASKHTLLIPASQWTFALVDSHPHTHSRVHSHLQHTPHSQPNGTIPSQCLCQVSSPASLQQNHLFPFYHLFCPGLLALPFVKLITDCLVPWAVLWVHIFSRQMYSMFLEGTWVYQVCIAQNWVLQKIFTEWNDFLHLRALPRNIAQYPIRVISYLKMWFANEEESCSTFLFSKASLWVRFLFRGKTYISN